MRRGRRQLLIALGAALSGVMCVGLGFRAYELYHWPFPLWMGDAPRWYHAGLDAGMWAVGGVACLVYLCRRRGHGRRTAAEVSPVAVRWRDRVEVRVVLYCFAASMAVRLPLGILNSIRAVEADPSPFGNTLWAAFPIDAIIGPIAAIVVVAYDRRRIRREAREKAGACVSCGYDLRATPGRCPECGVVPPKAPT